MTAVLLIADTHLGPGRAGRLIERIGGELADADVVLAPEAVAATVALLADTGLDLVSPYPRQDAPGATRLVQPLLQWSWLTFLPLRLAERSARPSLSAANGQLLAVTRAAYDRAGGHAAVALAAARDLENVWQAVDTRKLIGQAQGMLMERYRLGPDQAMAVLLRYSQDSNLKLRMVAERLIETSRLPQVPEEDAREPEEAAEP